MTSIEDSRSDTPACVEEIAPTQEPRHHRYCASVSTR